MPLLNKHIVAIDDTHSILTFLRISLEALGATFHGAATASGGLALCETEHPDLVILDLGLPDKEGLDILPRLKHLNKEHNLPIVVLTVRKEQETIAKAMELGADAYVTKPFIMEDLIEVLHTHLKNNNNGRLKLVKGDKNGTTAANGSSNQLLPAKPGG